MKSPSMAGLNGAKPVDEIFMALLIREKGRARRQEREFPEERLEAQGVLETSVS
jgi:hypothetical protein